MDDEDTVWHREEFDDGKYLLCAEGESRYVSSWGVWEDGDQEKKRIEQVLHGRFH